MMKTTMFGTYAFMDLGVPDLILIPAVVLLLIASRRLPELMRGLRESLSEVRKGIHEDKPKSESGAKRPKE